MSRESGGGGRSSFEGGKNLEAEREKMFRAQAEEMLAKGKEMGVKPPKPEKEWIEDYVKAMQGLSEFVKEDFKEFPPVRIGNFDSNELGLEWNEQDEKGSFGVSFSRGE